MLVTELCLGLVSADEAVVIIATPVVGPIS